MKKFICILLVLSTLLCISVQSIFAKTEYNLSEVLNSKHLYAQSNQTGGYVFGFSNNTLYSSRLIPNSKNYKITTSYNIACTVQNGKYTEALYSNNANHKKLSICELNTDNGSFKDFDFIFSYNVQKQSFSVSSGKAYFISPDDVMAYVASYSLSGSHYCDYKFSNHSVIFLFNNNSTTYCQLDNGDIYKLSDKKQTYCTNVSPNESFYDAGENYICTERGVLISLANNKSITSLPKENYSVSVSDDYIYSASANKIYSEKGNSVKSYNTTSDMLVSYKSKIASVNKSRQTYTVIEQNEFKSATTDNSYDTSNTNNSGINNTDTISGSKYAISSDTICNIDCGLTVSKFKDGFFDDNVTIYNQNGNKVTSGKLKTGYSVNYKSKTYMIALKGDVTSTGTISRNDVSLLANFLIGNKTLSSVCKKAADFNIDGEINNIDLLKISRHKE